MLIVDANIVLRYILDEPVELAARAADILECYEVIVPMEIVSEVVYVLQKVYQVPRKEIQVKLCDLLDERLITVQKVEVLRHALSIYGEENLDFADTLLVAYHTVEHCQVETFDKKLQKYLVRE